MRNLSIGFFLISFCAFVSSQRVCSDKPPNERDLKECCPRLPTPIDMALGQACSSNYTKNTEQQMKAMQTNDLPKGDCVFECIANVTKIYRGNGLIDQVTLTRLYLNAVSGDKLFGDIVTSAIAVCMNETRVKTNELRQSASMKTTFAGEMLCNPISGYVFGCLTTELFNRCPNMTQQVECNALLQYSQNCHLTIRF